MPIKKIQEVFDLVEILAMIQLDAFERGEKKEPLKLEPIIDAFDKITDRFEEEFELGREEERKKIIEEIEKIEKGGLLNEKEDLIREETIDEILKTISKRDKK